MFFCAWSQSKYEFFFTTESVRTIVFIFIDILVIHPFGRPEYLNFLKPILFMDRDSSSGFRQGCYTFLYGHKKYNRGSGKKEQTNNMDLGQLQVQEG